MIGIDKDCRVCVIELKNRPVTAEVLPQVLGYAIWAETSPDSVKNLWLESKEKPEGVEVDWDNMEIRIIVVGPSFESNVLKLASKIEYQIDLLKIQRFTFEEDDFLLVEVLEEEIQPRAGTTKTLVTYDREFYESFHGKELWINS